MLCFARNLASAMTIAVVIVAAAQAAPTYIYPWIQGHGKVVQLPDAAEQPRAGSKICVDLTASGPVDAINPGVEKVARYVNIYAGAGREPTSCQITVVLHGNATSVGLSDTAYAKHCDTDHNPNLPLIRDLRKAGVEFVVCGQAMAGKGYEPTETAEEVTLVVSALTALVNRQMDGFAYVPLQ